MTTGTMRSMRGSSALTFAVGSIAVIVLGASVTGCAGYPVPLSAQAGSSIVVPLAAGESDVIGFGGASHTDYQRGAMIYRLDGPTGMELTTRFSIAAEAHASSLMAGSWFAFANPPSIISLVDIPANAPEGA